MGGGRRAAVAGAVLASTLLLSAPGGAAASGCPKPPRPAELEIEVIEPEVEVERGRAQEELTRIAAEQYGYQHTAGSAVFGLTTGRIRSQLSVSTWTGKRSDGVHCVWPARIHVSVGYQGPITVHVAREYREGSCQHRAVLEHEMEHVAVFTDALRDYETRLRKALERVLERQRFPVTGRNSDKAGAALSGRFEEAFRSAVTAADAERDRRNGLVDTRENYARTKRLCTSW